VLTRPTIATSSTVSLRPTRSPSQPPAATTALLRQSVTHQYHAAGHLRSRQNARRPLQNRKRNARLRFRQIPSKSRTTLSSLTMPCSPKTVKYTISLWQIKKLRKCPRCLYTVPSIMLTGPPRNCTSRLWEVFLLNLRSILRRKSLSALTSAVTSLSWISIGSMWNRNRMSSTFGSRRLSNQSLSLLKTWLCLLSILTCGSSTQSLTARCLTLSKCFSDCASSSLRATMRLGSLNLSTRWNCLLRTSSSSVFWGLENPLTWRLSRLT